MVPSNYYQLLPSNCKLVPFVQGVPGVGGDALVVDEKKLGIIFVRPRVGGVGLQVLSPG